MFVQIAKLIPKLAFLISISLTVFAWTPALAQSSFKDRDWSTSAFANCKLPTSVNREKPVSWVGVNGDRKLLFQLQPGQVGRCSTDNRARHGAAFWERAELRQKGYLKLGKVNKISFEATFLEGFLGERETFFQIHGWNDGCPAYPPLMLSFDKGRLRVNALTGVKPNAGQVWLSKDQGQHRAVQERSFKVQSLYGRPQRFEVVFDASGSRSGLLTVNVNGQTLVDGARIEYAPCAKPHIKFGIYRPGKGTSASRLLFDDLSIRQR